MLSIPLTSRTCVNHGDNLKVEPNKDYMMADASRAGKTPQQVCSNKFKEKTEFICHAFISNILYLLVYSLLNFKAVVYLVYY